VDVGAVETKSTLPKISLKYHWVMTDWIFYLQIESATWISNLYS